MAICTTDDVEVRLGRELTDDEFDAVTEMIDAYQADIESILGRPIEPADFVEERYLPSGVVDLALSKSPVVSVASIVSGASTLDPSSYALTEGGVLFLNAFFSPDLLRSPSGETVLTITYRAGLDPERARPAKEAVIARTVRFVVQRQNLSQGVSEESVKDHAVEYRVKYAASTTGTFTPDELTACSRLRR